MRWGSRTLKVRGVARIAVLGGARVATLVTILARGAAVVAGQGEGREVVIERRRSPVDLAVALVAGQGEGEAHVIDRGGPLVV